MRASRAASAVAAGLMLVAGACSSLRHEAVPPTAVSLPRTTATTHVSTSTGGVLAARPHVLIVLMENREDRDVIGSPSAPYVNDLAARFGLATESFGASHPSLPNYLDLIAGGTLGITTDCTGCTVDAPVLADQFTSAGIPWAAYAEGMPSPCFTGASAPADYAKRHNPFVYVRHLVANATECGQVRPLSSFAADLASASPPDFVWVTPDLCHDGHDCDTATADAWLRSFIQPILGSGWYAAGGIVILTWDEGDSSAGCCNGAHGGHIATLVLSARTPPGSRLNTPVDHAGVLRTIEDLFGLPHLADAACPCSGSLAPLLGG